MQTEVTQDIPKLISELAVLLGINGGIAVMVEGLNVLQVIVLVITGIYTVVRTIYLINKMLNGRKKSN